MEADPQVSASMEEYQATCRADFGVFAEHAFEALNPDTSYKPNWHQDLIAAKLQACFQGEIRRLILNIPPRHLKSHFASVALPAFWLGHRPSAQIICVSYAQDLANKLSSDCRSLMLDPWYRETFPQTTLSQQRSAVDEFMTTERGFRMATSVGGVLTGRGADVIILDDPLKPDEAVSEAQRTKVNTWYEDTLYSRLNHKREGVIILVMQRLHLDDLVAHIQEKEAWEVVSLPAIAEEDEVHEFETEFGKQFHRRRVGEALHPEREDVSVLTAIRKNLGEYAFSAQYQQNPVPLGGGLIKSEWWKVYEQAPSSFDRIIQSWDTAQKTSELNDYSVGTTWGMKGGDLYLLDVVRQRMDYPTLKRVVRSAAQRHRADIILIEDKASGTSLLQDLKRDGLRGLQACKPEGDKVMRLNTHLNWIEDGHVLLPSEASWLGDYRKELEVFPRGKFDDQVDSTSQALAWAQRFQVKAPVTILGFGKRLSDQLGDSYMGAFAGTTIWDY